jgi:hypothetical protein
MKTKTLLTLAGVLWVIGLGAGAQEAAEKGAAEKGAVGLVEAARLLAGKSVR